MTISAVLETLRGLTPAMPAPSQVPPQPAGWSDRLQRDTLEPVANHPGQWQEPEASAVLCTKCADPLATGDLLSCEQHQLDIGVTARPARPARSTVAVTSAPAIGRHDLLALAELRGWEALAFTPGERAGGTEAMWRTFAETARGKTLRLALAAVWERWRDTVAQYSQGAALAAPGAREAA